MGRRMSASTLSLGLRSPVVEVVAGGQGLGVLGAQDPLADGQQRGVLVAGPGRIPRLPGPVGPILAFPCPSMITYRSSTSRAWSSVVNPGFTSAREIERAGSRLS